MRARFADVLAERARARRATYQPQQRDEILARLALNDEGGVRRARWNAPGEIRARRARPARAVQLYRYRDDHGLRTSGAPAPTRSRRGSLLPARLAICSSPGATRLPLLVERGERRRVDVDAAAPPAVPDGFIYVPAGRFLYGYSGSDDLRREFFTAVPLHAVDTGAYLIARHETTYADWIAYLERAAGRRARAPPGRRRRQLPRRRRRAHGARAAAGTSSIRPREAAYDARWGEPIRYRDRAIAREQDWRRMPVSGVSLRDAEAYASWLVVDRPRPRRPPVHREWSGSAPRRGADDREFPHGDRLEPDDANFDGTYGQKLDAFGPDEVGQHPASRSPFGVDDMIGNIFEWTHSSLLRGEATIRGSCYYYGRKMTRVYYRETMNADDRTQMIGIRICGDLPR